LQDKALRATLMRLHQLQGAAVNYLSVCSGIEAATVAWHPLGWESVAFAEIEKFPSQVLKYHYPDVPNVGDFTKIRGDEFGTVDVLAAGTPCQDFSVAGLRAGMDGQRGQLTIEFAHLASRLRPRWLVWENVPGILSIDGGRAFGVFLGLLGQLGYGFAYRILDAQYAGIPQRRRRVFVVGHLGDWRRAAAVLFERHSLSGHPAPRREKGKGTTYELAPCIGASGRGFERTGDTRGQDCLVASTGNVPHCLNAGGMGRQDYETETLVVGSFEQNSMAGRGTLGWSDGDQSLRPVKPQCDHQMIVTHALRADGFDASEDETGRGAPLVPVAFDTTQMTSKANHSNPKAGDPCHPLAAGAHAPAITSGMEVRRLTPEECEALQGFPRGYTKISEKTADGPRYKALGNSMAVPVMKWLGSRIQMVEDITNGKTE
jgi:DNA (cytosine-5)-methyltransferase 1